MTTRDPRGKFRGPAKIVRRERRTTHGRVFKVWFECSACGSNAQSDANYCFSCGEQFSPGIMTEKG